MDRFETESLRTMPGQRVRATVLGHRPWGVIAQIAGYEPPAWVRLSIRPGDLEPFGRPCGFCGRRVVLSAGGDGLVLDVRSNDGPGRHTVIAHRTCLADCIDPGSIGERTRVLTVERSST